MGGFRTSLGLLMNHDKKYLNGFRNHFETEAVSGAIPKKQNSPKKHPLGLYAEQISGSAFTAPRADNLKTWVYRIRPSVVHGPFVRSKLAASWHSAMNAENLTPNQLRWGPLYSVQPKIDFIESIVNVVSNGEPLNQKGIAIHVYAASKSMGNTFLQNADAEMLFVPQDGEHVFQTEMGMIQAGPQEIVVIPRGIKFSLSPKGAAAKGYVCENFGQPFNLPGLGPIGANGLANARHFESPVASFSETAGTHTLLMRAGGALFESKLNHHPLDVVGWSGNYAPYKYDLRLFNTINTVSFDHPDPSIFTVLTSASETPGVANCDFVIFPPRWMVAENTFRPPYFHRNPMSEFMGLIHGIYDAKEGGGFAPGGSSLHNCMSAHGPDAETFAKASDGSENPHKIDNTMAFMLESRWPFAPSDEALNSPALQKDYQACWQGLKPLFKST